MAIAHSGMSFFFHLINGTLPWEGFHLSASEIKKDSESDDHLPLLQRSMDGPRPGNQARTLACRVKGGGCRSVDRSCGVITMNKPYNAFDALLTKKAKKDLEPISVEIRAMMEVADIFNNIMHQNQWSKKQLAEALGVTAGYVTRILAGDENLSIGNVAKLLNKLGRSYHQYSGKKTDSRNHTERFQFQQKPCNS